MDYEIIQVFEKNSVKDSNIDKTIIKIKDVAIKLYEILDEDGKIVYIKIFAKYLLKK